MQFDVWRAQLRLPWLVVVFTVQVNVVRREPDLSLALSRFVLFTSQLEVLEGVLELHER